MANLKIAIIGSGISGLSAAYSLSQYSNHEITILEKSNRLGGHTNTIEFQSNGKTVAVDTGFIVCNPQTYPNFIRLMDLVNVPLVNSNMSFSVSLNGLVWAGRNLKTLFCQLSNLFNLKFYRMIYDIWRFNRNATALANNSDSPQNAHLANVSIGEYLRMHGYSRFFYDYYIVPMTAAIWSCPAETALNHFPILTLVCFMRNHCLLQIGNRPTWLTVENGSSRYIPKLVEKVSNIYTGWDTTSVIRNDQKVLITNTNGVELEFDHVIFATHPDQALSILGANATEAESKILGAFKYTPNTATVHQDSSLMPPLKSAWSAWNYLGGDRVSLTYYMNTLQPFIPKECGPLFVTLNTTKQINGTIIRQIEYEHPIYDNKSVQAQLELDQIQNDNRTCFIGAWTNFGFHEDACTSGLLAAASLGASLPFTVAMNGGFETKRKPMAVPGYLRGVVGTVKVEKSRNVVIESCGYRWSILGGIVVVVGAVFWAKI